MADRVVLLQPRKVELASATLANLLTKVKTITTIGTAVSAASQDEIFSSVVDGTAGLFIGDASGKVQGATATENASTALTPVTTQTGLLPRDLLNSPTDANAGNFLVHMYDGNTTPTEVGNRHRSFSLLKLKDYIGGAAVAAIGKVKVDSNDSNADFLLAKMTVNNQSFVTLGTQKETSTLDKVSITCNTNVSSQFLVTGAKQLTIQAISGGSI